MPVSKLYKGGCHCGRVRYEATVDLDNTMKCNCSICSKRNWILTFAGADHFKLTSGDAALTDYQFGKKNIHHLFCTTCGTQSFGRGTAKDGSSMYAVNVNCLDDVDVSRLIPRAVDGKSL